MTYFFISKTKLISQIWCEDEDEDWGSHNKTVKKWLMLSDVPLPLSTLSPSVDKTSVKILAMNKKLMTAI